MKFLTISVIASFAACLIFTAVCFAFVVRGYAVPDTLIECFFRVFGVEFAATAAIKITKQIIKRAEREDKIETLKENDIPITREDVAVSDSDDDDYYDSGTVYG